MKAIVTEFTRERNRPDVNIIITHILIDTYTVEYKGSLRGTRSLQPTVVRRRHLFVSLRTAKQKPERRKTNDTIEINEVGKGWRSQLNTEKEGGGVLERHGA